MATPTLIDYRLTGPNASSAIQAGLAEADWYTSPIPRETLRGLLERRNGPAVKDTLLWLGLIAITGVLGGALWGTWWSVGPFAIYGVLYASTSDSRWHEAGHGTAFRSDWMNVALYELASFMVLRESSVWRWSHNRHHSDTIIVGRDPEIAVPRPPDVTGLILGAFSLNLLPKYFRHVVLHSVGRITLEEQAFIPLGEHRSIFMKARIHLAIYSSVLLVAILSKSVLPLMYVGLPSIYGAWLMSIYGLTQHAGLAENVLDHRLNCRTVYMNRVNRFLYWNMNYHIEHHMFPLVPYHALPRLHEAIKHDTPAPYASLWAAWREIIPALARQMSDPAYHVKRKLPEQRDVASEGPANMCSHANPDADGWLEVISLKRLKPGEPLRFDHGRRTYAIFRCADGRFFATDGICTHGNAHLAEGLLAGSVIECPKHNGRFSLEDGSAVRAPACLGLRTYVCEVRDEILYVNVRNPGGAGVRAPSTQKLSVVSNVNVATFIKELVLEPVDGVHMTYSAGDYIQLEIPSYDEISFRSFEIESKFASVWEVQHLYDLVAKNPGPARRNNYSLAGNPVSDRQYRLNVRIATPPPGQDCPPGVGSSYLFNLRPGDLLTSSGPFGDFHIKPTQKEMIYIGGGAGMAPIRSHISTLFDTMATSRKVSFWYGARSEQEVFYEALFRNLEARFKNFKFHVALSDIETPPPVGFHSGFIHEVVLRECLKTHPNPRAVEFYLCGPPKMIKACSRMLADVGVGSGQIAYDEF